MSNKIQAALDARNARISGQKPSIDLALKAREHRITSNLQSTFSDLENSINSEIVAFKKISNPSWGGGNDSLANLLESTRQNRINVENLIRKVEAHRKYLGDEKADAILNPLNQMRDGYNTYSKVAEIRSKYNTEEEYEKKIKESEKAQADYEAMTTFDLEVGENEIEGLLKGDEIISLKKRQAEIKEQMNKLGNPGKGVKFQQKQKLQQELNEVNAKIKDIENQASQKRVYWNQAKNIQEGVKYHNDAINAEDFGDYNVSNVDFAEDRTYKYINDIDNFRAAEKEFWTKNNTYTTDTGMVFPTLKPSYMEGNLEYMNEDEIGIFNYYYSKFGKEKAYKYLDNLKQTLNTRSAVKIRAQNDTDFERILFGVTAGLDQFSSGMKNLFNTKDEYITPSDTQIASGMIREDLGNSDFKILGSTIGQMGYDLINTTSNMLPSILTSTVVGWINPAAGAVVGAGLMGASASGNAYAEMLNLGYDKGQARLYSGLVGVSEATLQYLVGGIGKLGGKVSSKVAVGIANNLDNAIARVAIKLGGNALGEFTEEYLQEILDPVFKNLTLGTNEDIKLFSAEALYSGILGALSAGLLEGGSTISTDIKTTKLGKSVQNIDGGVERLKKLGTTFSVDTVAHKIADKITEKTGAYKIGLLLHEVGGSLSEQNVSDIVTELTKKNIDKRSAKRIAKTYQAFLEGEMSLTDRQVEVLEKLDPLSDVLRKSIIGRNSSIYQRSREYNDLLQLATKTESKTKNPIPSKTGAVENFKIDASYSQEDIDVAENNGYNNTVENEVDTVQNNGYNNSVRGENYVRTDEFRDIQAESKGMSNEDIQLFHSGNREIDDGLRERFSRSVKSIFLASNDNGIGNANGILSLSAKGNIFNIYENVNGSLFHDVFEIARNYLKFGELVDLHEIQTTEDGVGYDDCYNYLSEDGLSGFSITPDGDLISVFNASGKSGFLRAISDIVKDKAKTLDCYASPSQDLEAIYSVIFGFKTASIMDYNMDYDHDEIATNHDNPQVAFMVNTNSDVKTKHFTKEQYDEAKAYRDSFVKNSDLQSTAGGNISTLSAANPEYNPIEDLHYKSVGVERLTADQKRLKKVGQQFGAKVLFKDLDEIRIDQKTGKEFLFSPEGQFDPETNTITLNTNVKDYHRPLEYILKHELTHSLEIDKENYALFATQVLRSEAFLEYVRSKGFDSADAWATDIIKQYSGKGVKSYQGPKAQLLANQEMVANFVGDMLFGGRTDITEKLLSSMTPAQRKGFIAKIKEFFAKLKQFFKGTAELTEIERLENLFLETANKVAEYNKTATEGSGDIVYSEGNTHKKDKQYSFAVEKNASLVEEAEQLERELISKNKTDAEIREAIWKEYQIIRDSEGVWKYEIDDSGMEVYPNGDLLIKDHPDYKEYKALEKKKQRSEKQDDRFAELDDMFLLEYGYGEPLLKNYVKHDELFAKYPQLKQARIDFDELGPGKRGYYDPINNRIVLDERFKMQDKIAMNIDAIHEIQHAMQKIDNTEPGASEEYWNARLLRGERLPINPKTNKPYTPFEAYERTRGEIEAREASSRVDMTEEQRRETVPNLGWENSLSAREPVLMGEYDAEYSSAIENGNTAKAQRMVDAAAELFGYTERLYHQTDADFTEFNTNNQRAGKYDWELPTGTFLKPTNDDIGLSGKKQMELYANIKNPLEFANRYEAQKYWSENIPGYNAAASEVLNIDAKYRAQVDAAVDAIQHYSKEWRNKHPNESRRAIYNDVEYQRLSDRQADIIEEWESASNKASLKAKKLIDSYITKNNYDGIIIEHDKDGENRETKSYIVFSSAQLKSAAPVTYDDSGNVISLSERFNENQSDIRYSIPEINNSVENYTEEQYNNFGWARYNEILSNKDIKYITSEIQKIANGNARGYVLTQYGDYIIPLGDQYNVLVYTDDNVESPHIRKVLRINSEDQVLLDSIRRDILNANSEKLQMADDYVRGIYGAEHFVEYKRQNFLSFRGYTRAEQERMARGTNSNVFKAGIDGGSALQENRGIDSLGKTDVIKHSISPTVDIDSVIDAVEKGEMSASEAKELLGRKTLNPTEIANLPKEMADLTLIHGEPKLVGTGDEESKFYESALNSKIITDEVKQEIENDTYIKNYHSTTNKKTLKMAMRELEEGGYTRANQFLKLEAEKGSAVDVAVGFILLERYQRASRIDDAILVAEKLREIGTAAGQTVQMFSILGRFTPEMMLEYSARELKKAYEEMVKTKSQAWIDKNKTKFELTKEDIVFIKNNILFASELEESRQKAILLAEVCTRVQNKIPPESGQSIRALQRISLLLNPKTNIRNILGNANMAGVYIVSDFFGSLIDRQIAKKTGIRTTGNYHLKGSGTALKKGLYESYDDFKRGIRTKQDELNRYDVNHGGGKSFNENHNGPLAKQLNAIAKGLNTLDNFTSFCLEAGDRPFFEMWFVNSLNNQMRLNNVDVPTPQMMEIARLEAERRTWQDSNTVSRSMSQLKRVLNKAHLPSSSYGFGDFVLKFVKTPANIAKAMVEFSPIGLATAGSKAVNFKNALSRGEFDATMQKEVVRSMSSAITGTLLYVLVAAGVALGAVDLSGGGDDDKDISNFEKYVVGIPPYSMKIFGQNVTYSWNQPVGVILATVADFMENKEDGISAPWYEDLLGAFKTGTAVFTEQSFLSSLYELFSAEDLATGVFEAVLSEPSAFMPQFVSQIASFTDPYRRTTYHKGNAWRSAINGIIYKIPGLRQTLPEQVNVLGETSKNTQYLNPWEAFLSPGNTYPESSGAVAEEIYELYKLTGNNSVMPRTAPYSYTAKGENISLTPEERNDFQRTIGVESVRILNVLFNSSDYKALNDEQKSDAVKKVYDYAYDKAKSQREYKYETVAAMSGGEKVLPKTKWDKLNKNSRQALVEDYFLTNEQLRCNDDAEKLAALFIKKSKE